MAETTTAAATTPAATGATTITDPTTTVAAAPAAATPAYGNSQFGTLFNGGALTGFDGLTGKALDKALGKTQKSFNQNLKSMQKAELFAMKHAGLGKDLIKAEKLANRDERLGLKMQLNGLNSGNYGTFAMPKLATAASSYSGDVGAGVTDLLGKTYDAARPTMRPTNTTCRR